MVNPDDDPLTEVRASLGWLPKHLINHRINVVDAEMEVTLVAEGEATEDSQPTYTDEPEEASDRDTDDLGEFGPGSEMYPPGIGDVHPSQYHVPRVRKDVQG